MNPTSNENEVSIPLPPPPPPPPPRRPRDDLLVGDREMYIGIGIPLYEASIRCDWNAAKSILDKRSELVWFSITENYETLLHVAASTRNNKQAEAFVRKLMDLMTMEDMELLNRNDNTALSLAAAAGNVKVAEIMVRRNKKLLQIPGSSGLMPLYVAALLGNYKTVRYLYRNSNKMTGDCWNDHNRGWVLLQCVETDMFDVALEIVKDRPELAESKNIYHDILLALARKTDACNIVKPHGIFRIIIKSFFAAIHLRVKMEPSEEESQALQFLRIIWINVAKLPKFDIDGILRGPPDPWNETNTTRYSSRVLFVATRMGNTRFIIELIRQYPDIIWKTNDENQSIFHAAILHRQKNVYNLLYDLGSMRDLITPLRDRKDNNMLHLVGVIAENTQLPNVSGVALQMQRELSWFKEIEDMIPPSYRQRKNKKGLSPYELFNKTHTDLASKGEEWMKETAAQCMVVAALIATVVFAAAFTVPGGYDQNTGLPMFLHDTSFIVFVVSDTVSLVFASTSILTFFSILTARYAQQDFFESLPKKLLIGLATLFLSIVSMMIAFSVSFAVLYHKKLIWVPILTGVLAILPVTFFLRLQYHLLADVFRSTYGSTYLFKSRKIRLY